MSTKSDTRYQLGFVVQLRFVLRFLGLTALLAIGAGILLLATTHTANWSIEMAIQAVQRKHGDDIFIGCLLVGIGAVFVGLALLGELLSLLGGSSSRRSAVGANAALQTLLAVGLLGAVNVYSFLHSSRFDLTRNHNFTLSNEVTNELRPLQSDMTIVILQQHKSVGKLATKPDPYDYAAERVVVEKIKDLIEKFRESGPQFKVHVLDVEEKDYDDKLKELTRLRPGLLDAIYAAPESCIFFYSDSDVVRWTEPEVLRLNPPSRSPDPNNPGKFLVYQSHVQRLNFNEFYLLDKQASKAANENKGNLVLQPQGLGPILSRITANQDKKPKIVLASCHEALSSTTSPATPDEYSHNGLRKSLEEQGFEVVDLILKKFETRDVKAVAYNMSENAVDKYAAQLNSIQVNITTNREERDLFLDNMELYANPEAKSTEILRKKLKREPTADEVRDRVAAFKKSYKAQLGRELTEDVQLKLVEEFRKAIAELDEELPKLEEKRQAADKKLQETFKDERALEDRQVTDLEAKMTRILDDCDLLIIPRPTLINIHAGMMIPRNVFALRDREDNDLGGPKPPVALAKQVKVIRNYIAKGKPVLACLGPTNDRRSGAMKEPLDDFEKTLAELGIEMGKQTILYNVEESDFANEDAEESFGTGGDSDIPSIVFRAPYTMVPPFPHPIARAMRVSERSVNENLNIRLRHPRPVYLSNLLSKRQPNGEFMFTTADCWNEDKPFVGYEMLRNGSSAKSYTPRFELSTNLNDPRKGTHDEERRGPFTVGVAVEVRAPLAWRIDKPQTGPNAGKQPLPNSDDRPLSRLVVIGHGGLFSGKQLNPASEKLLLNTCNWLLGRDDRLPRSSFEEQKPTEKLKQEWLALENPWEFPRVTMEPRDKMLWGWGTFLGVPAAFAYLGMVVLMIRRFR